MASVPPNPLYDDAVIFKRWSLLIDTFDIFREKYEQNPAVKNTVAIDPVALFQAVRSYYHDVARFKLWHFKNPATDLIDGRKQFAFTLFWLMKMRPVYISSDTKAIIAQFKADPRAFKDDITLSVNAHFSVMVAFNFLGFGVQGPVLKELLYHVTYRLAAASELMLYADALRAIIESGPDTVLRRFNDDVSTTLSGAD